MSGRFLMALALASLAVSGGCALHNSPRNRPGHVDLETPPDNPANREVAYPRDPGERVVSLSAGLFGGGGPRFQPDRAVAGASSLGFEATVKTGITPVSHANSNQLGPLPFLLPPPTTLGMNVGWSWLDGPQQGRVGPVYVEAQATYSFAGAAAGYVVDPRPLAGTGTGALSGFQTTLFAGPLFMRVSHYPGHRTDLFFGALVKLEGRLRFSR